MRSKEFHVVGIDLSEKMIEHTKSKYPDIDFQLGDMTKLPFPAGSFDGILASYCLIHQTNDVVASVLARLYEILRPGGFIYLSIQSGSSTQGFFSHTLIPGDQVFLNIFSKEEVFDLLSERGLKVVVHHEKAPQGKIFNFMKLFIIVKKTITDVKMNADTK